ncbi:MAG: polysaccharide deacetylase family protein [Actinomycetota bacterium]|nr:polysaccharide deacetylase family protein [Actinomycetota bacterium]
MLILIGVLVLVTTGIVYSVSWLEKHQLVGDYVRSVETDKKIIALTFDDGPNPGDPTVTKNILALLKRYNAEATFFVIGKNAVIHPEIVREEYQEGNEVGNHSWCHENLVFKSPWFVKREIDDTDTFIRSTGYKGTIYFRAPGGQRFIILPLILMLKHRIHILWDQNVLLYDFDNPPPAPEKMLQIFDTHVQPGSIVLLHDGYPGAFENRENTVKVTEMILDKYTKLGYEFVTISELLANKKAIIH